MTELFKYLPIETDDSHATFANSGWVANDFQAWLKTKGDDGYISHDVLVGATFEYVPELAVVPTSSEARLPSLDLQLDFNQSHLTPIRLGQCTSEQGGGDVIPFRFELELLDVDFDLDADKMKLSLLSFAYSSGIYYERNSAYETFNDRKSLPVTVVDRVREESDVDASLDARAQWKPEEYEDDVAMVRASVSGIVKIGTATAPEPTEPGALRQTERTMNVVLDLRGAGGVPFGSKSFKMFPSTVIDTDGNLVGEPFHFQLEHDFEVPLERIGETTLTATVYAK